MVGDYGYVVVDNVVGFSVVLFEYSWVDGGLVSEFFIGGNNVLEDVVVVDVCVGNGYLVLRKFWYIDFFLCNGNIYSLVFIDLSSCVEFGYSFVGSDDGVCFCEIIYSYGCVRWD